MINEFSKVAGYKVNIKKLVVFVYTSKERLERETKKTILFIIALKINKIIKNKFNQGWNNLHSKNYKTLKIKIEKEKLNGGI